MKYGAWLDEWYANYVVPSSKSKTCERYAEVVERHLKPRLGDYELGALTPLVLQRYVTELTCAGNLTTGAGLAPNTVNCIITMIQSSLKYAYSSGATESYTADRIRRPKVKEREIACFTLSEQKKIEQAVLSMQKPRMLGIVLCLYSGLRIGELLALTWADVDLVKGTLSVNKTCHDGKGRDGCFCRIVESPKTASSKRVIPIPRALLRLMRQWKRESRGICLVSDEEGGSPSVRSYQKAFSVLLRQAGIPHRGFHALRHTFATRALECNMDVKTLSEVLGHKSVGVTLNRYAHSLLEHKTEMMNRVGKLL